MTTKNKLKIPGWKSVSKYLDLETSEGDALAILEADKIFLRVVRQRGYKAKDDSGKVLIATRELKVPDSILKARDVADSIRHTVGYDVGTAYEARSIIEIYEDATANILFGEIDERYLHSWKPRFWPFYYHFFLNRKKIKKIFLWLLALMILVVFIADTALGKDVFIYSVSLVHTIARVLLVLSGIVLIIAFLVIISIMGVEAYYRRKVRRRPN